MAVLGEDKLGDVALGAGLAAGDGAFGGAEVEQAQGLLLGRVGADALGAAGDAVAVLGVEETTSGPVRPPAPPPMLTRSLPRVARATVQPWLGVPTTSASGTKTSEKNTSLNSESPVVCRSGRTSTPGCFMSMTTMVTPECFGASGSVRTVAKPQRQ